MSPFIFPYSGFNRLKNIFVKAKRYKLEQGGYTFFLTAEGPLLCNFNHIWQGLEVLHQVEISSHSEYPVPISTSLETLLPPLLILYFKLYLFDSILLLLPLETFSSD